MITLDPEQGDFAELFRCFFASPHTMIDQKVIKDAFFTGSGKASISMILSFLANQGLAERKSSSIITPKWLGFNVYNTINEFFHPVHLHDKDSKLYLSYHQYGFPQNMEKVVEYCKDKDLILIEDCAHALGGTYKGKDLGSFGDFSIYSFSKFFYCHSLGGVRCNNNIFLDKFQEYYDKRVDESSSALAVFINFQKFIMSYAQNKDAIYLRHKASLLGKMLYGVYGDSASYTKGATCLFQRKVHNEVSLRKKRYTELLHEFSNFSIFDHLERDGVVPYAIPLIADEVTNSKIAIALKSNGYESGVYHFDTNRFAIEPNYQKSVLIPFSKIEDDLEFERLIGILKIFL